MWMQLLKWKYLPKDIVDIILEYEGSTIRKRNGQYMNQLTKDRLMHVCDLLRRTPKIQIKVSPTGYHYDIVYFTNTKFTLSKDILSINPNNYEPIAFNEICEDVYGWRYIYYKATSHYSVYGGNIYFLVKKYTIFDHLYENLCCVCDLHR